MQVPEYERIKKTLIVVMGSFGGREIPGYGRLTMELEDEGWKQFDALGREGFMPTASEFKAVLARLRDDGHFEPAATKQ